MIGGRPQANVGKGRATVFEKRRRGFEGYSFSEDRSEAEIESKAREVERGREREREGERERREREVSNTEGSEGKKKEEEMAFPEKENTYKSKGDDARGLISS